MESRESELKARFLVLQAAMDSKEEILRQLSESVGNMSKNLNDIQYEDNQKKLPEVREKLAKKQRIIEQENHDAKIIGDKITALSKTKLKLVQDLAKLEAKTPKKVQQVQPFGAKQNTEENINQPSKLKSFLDHHLNYSIPTLIESFSNSSQDKSQLDSINNEQHQNQIQEKQAVLDESKPSLDKNKNEEEEEEEEQEEDQNNSDEDGDDILARIQANLKQNSSEEGNENSLPEGEDNSDGDEEEKEEEGEEIQQTN